ncbi:bifunctional folylpolyglutamate synthase/dihydrofolate synthase [Carnobacterium sp.]|uniref:bifunctional folylpolyglutamate synthase/dihydrofolate synthase n=1 Tax=Carnobacterium sp. TaxID=48221 RepID=UPI003C7336F8
MIKTYAEALDWIHGRTHFGVRPGLSRIRYLLKQLGNPQDELKTIHVAGTNGKGSTVTYLQEMFLAKKMKVGTFTSPYIILFNERISINGEPISNEELIQLVNKVIPIINEMDATDSELHGITEFEVITAMMFDYFLKEEVDVAVVEVGLGGLLDCTNVIKIPVVSGIITIGLDHIDILGDTIEEIATQKAGIIKKNCPVVTGNIPQEAMVVIQNRAKDKQAKLYRFNEEYQVQLEGNQGDFIFRNETAILESLHTSLTGRHQIDNAALAIQLFQVYMEKEKIVYTQNQIKEGLERAFIAGRMETLSESPLVIIDGAHNVPAIYKLKENISSSFIGNQFKNKKLKIIFAAIDTKDIVGMLTLLEDIPNSELILTSFYNDKARPVKELAKLASVVHQVYPNWEEAVFKTLSEVKEDEALLITGSLYFISDVRKKFSQTSIYFKEKRTKEFAIDVL